MKATPEQLKLLRDLHQEDAWPLEKAKRLGVWQPWLSGKYVAVMDTAIGPFCVLRARGRKRVTGSVTDTCSVSRRLDRAYLRLCLESLGWQETACPDHLRELRRWPDLTAVHTPEGLKFVAAKLTGGGYSSTGIKRLAQTLKATALSRNLDVVVLTPSARRGHQAGQRFQSFLEVLAINPLPGQGKRVNPVVSTREGKPDPGPYITAVTAGDWREQLPYLSRQILQRPRKERIDRALSDLKFDSVITQEQLERHYGLTRDDLPGVLMTSALVRPVHGSFGLDVATTFFLADRQVARLDEHHLAHRAGLGEMRRACSIPASRAWHVDPRERLSFEQPDALLETKDGLIAFEYDNGSYDDRKLWKKQESFKNRSFRQVTWGVPSVIRQRHLQQKLKQVVILVQWWLKRPRP